MPQAVKQLNVSIATRYKDRLIMAQDACIVLCAILVMAVSIGSLLVIITLIANMDMTGTKASKKH